MEQAHSAFTDCRLTPEFPPVELFFGLGFTDDCSRGGRKEKGAECRAGLA